MDLVALEEIKRLKYRYLRCLDGKEWDEFTETLSPAVSAKYGKFVFDDRDQLVKFMRKHMGRMDMLTEHHCGHPEIDIDGDTARATWQLSDTVLMPEAGYLLRGAAVYHDEYVRVDGRWLISRTGYERTFEYHVKLEDMPSFMLTANRWA